MYPGEFGQILDGTTYSEATRVLEHLSKTGMELNYNRLVAGTGQMKGYAQKIEYLAKGRFWNLLRYDRLYRLSGISDTILWTTGHERGKH